MPPTAQEMASELHAWRGAAARSRSTVKGGAAGPASPAGAVAAHRPGGRAGRDREARGTPWVAGTGRRRRRPFVGRGVPAPQPPSPLEPRAVARPRSSTVALGTCRVSGALSVCTRRQGLSPKLPALRGVPRASFPALSPPTGSSPPSSLLNIKGIHINNRVFICY